MSKQSYLTTLTEDIAKDTKIITDYLESNHYPEPSPRRDTPAFTLPPTAPEDVRKARDNVLESTLKLCQVVSGPSEYIRELQYGCAYYVSVRWLSHFKIFDLVPLEGSLPYHELAARASVPEPLLKKVARMAMTSGLFDEPTSDHIAHSAISAFHTADPDFVNYKGMVTELAIPAAFQTIEATIKYPTSAKKNETAYNIAFDTPLPFFAHLTRERTDEFAGAMRAQGRFGISGFDSLVNDFDWAGLGEATVVDVGGSTGTACIALAKAYPELTLVVQDLPSVVAVGEKDIKTLPSELSERISFQAHDFFKPQPVKNAAVYILRQILHDWPAKEAGEILSQLVLVMGPDSKIVINEIVVPFPGVLPASQERRIRTLDLLMKQLFNSQERALEEWKSVFAQGDKRLVLENVMQPPSSIYSIMTLGLEKE